MTSEDWTGEAQARKGRADDEPGSEDRADGNQSDGGQAGENQIGRGQAGRGQADGDQDRPRPRDDRLHLDLTDPKAMRALAHPLRWALLEALGHAGTLTATQASEMLGESPANCAFHLRTLAKYGFVEEAGGGKGRERPWRQAYRRLSWQARQGDEQFRLAGQALNQIWLDRVLSRARRSLAATASWPEGFEDDLGGSTSMLYVTPDEARELYGELMKTVERTIGQEHRFTERKDPARRPPGAVPVEFVLLGYPVLDAPPLPGDGDDSDSYVSDTGDPGAGHGG
jgi:helix-turn-helix protein